MIASMHIVRERPGRQPLVLARLGSDRLRARTVEGLRFVRWLGTGAGDNTALSADLRRSAVFAVWDDDAALDAFLATHSIPDRWSRADEVWSVRLRSAGGHGTWRGQPIVDMLAPAAPLGPDDRVAIITHADVRPRFWRAFAAAGRRVNDEVRQAPGLLGVVGIGEAPIGRLGTFSLWHNLDAARTFATTMPHHATTVARTRGQDWYRDELFARFVPYASTGSWEGRDPLASRDDDGRDDRGTTGNNMP